VQKITVYMLSYNKLLIGQQTLTSNEEQTLNNKQTEKSI